MKHVVAVIQFLLGFIFGVLLLAGGTAAAAYYYFTKMAVAPPKPVFTEEQPEPAPEASVQNSAGETSQQKSSAPASKKKELEPGAYYARVTWPEGLSLRDKPSFNAQRIGGIGHHAKIIVLKESDDKKWQRVRIPETDEEGWVKGGNVIKVDN